MRKIAIFDSMLRDGAQAEGISFSVKDKLKIVKALDTFGVGYIEAGNPASNPKDLEFFEEVKKIKLGNSKLVAFGSTRRPDITAAVDKNLQSLLSAETPAVAVFGKCWDFHVTEIIHTTPEENLAMISETVAFLKENGKEVIFDAEHFFDGFKANPLYAMAALAAADEAGADVLALCDTNGGSFPMEVFDIVSKVRERFGDKIGIHCHNDSGVAVANSLMAVEAGASHVQGTFIGYGERCGNANLSTIIPNLQLKQSMDCVPPENMPLLARTARYIAEISNVILLDKMPYVGRSAFSHKAGMHVDGVAKASGSFEHISPDAVGNERRFLTSEVAGRMAILEQIKKIDPSKNKNSPETEQIVRKIKELEHQGYQFEGAEGSVSLIIRKNLGLYNTFFELVNFKIIGEQPYTEGSSASAFIKIMVDGKPEVTASEGDGPVNALDKALRRALEVFYPNAADMHLIDYKVRVMDSAAATASVVRVLIESSDQDESWCTVGVSKDIIEASWLALVDSIEYKLTKDRENALA
jgi:2-isopropylmalate synthase/homocitrate synthase family protein